MKTIIRSTSVALFLVAIIALGAVANFAQDACGDAEGQTKLGDSFRELYPKKDIPGRKDAISTGKQFLEKYGACESAKELSEYLKTTLPKMEANLAKVEKAAREAEIANRFNAARARASRTGMHSTSPTPNRCLGSGRAPTPPYTRPAPRHPPRRRPRTASGDATSHHGPTASEHVRHEAQPRNVLPRPPPMSTCCHNGSDQHRSRHPRNATCG